MKEICSHVLKASFSRDLLFFFFKNLINIGKICSGKTKEICSRFLKSILLERLRVFFQKISFTKSVKSIIKKKKKRKKREKKTTKKKQSVNEIQQDDRFGLDLWQ